MLGVAWRPGPLALRRLRSKGKEPLLNIVTAFPVLELLEEKPRRSK